MIGLLGSVRVNGVEPLDQGRLIELLPNYACDDISLYATYSDRRNLHARLRRFLDYLADNISV
jgi:DNA-binding transcriptional LysR family regulator